MTESTQIAMDAATPLLVVAQREAVASLPRRFALIQEWLATDLAALETHLGAVGPPDGDVAWQAVRYLLARPGKRVRPLCVLLAARLGGRGFDAPVRDVAVACELVHAATLLHDDVIDEGDTRRGVPAARRVYSNAASVLGGDHLFIDALRRVQAPKLRTYFLEIIAEMVAAEAFQLERRGRFEPDREAYLRVVRGKTAALFRFALWAGGALGGLNDAQLQALAEFGDALGMAFQVVDDLLDLRGDPAVMGKAAGVDLREGKLTWPLLLAAERDPALARQMAAIATTAELDVTAAANVVTAVHRMGVIAETVELAQHQAERARTALARLPAGPVSGALATVIETVVERSR